MKKLYSTEQKINGLTFIGENIEAESFEEATFKANIKGLTVIGELISVIPTDEYNNPLWELRIDYDYKVKMN